MATTRVVHQWSGLLRSINHGYGLQLPVAVRCILAIGIFGLALTLRLIMLPVETGVVFITFYPAATICALTLGLGPGFLVLLMGGLSGALVFMPDSTLAIERVYAVLIYLFSNCLVFAIIYQMRRHAIALGGALGESEDLYKVIEDHKTRLEARVRERTAELEASENRIRAVLHTMLDSVVLMNEHGTILSANHAVTLMFGYAEDELPGQDVSLLMPEIREASKPGNLFDVMATAGNRIQGIAREAIARRKDGSTFSVELATNPLIDEAGTSFIGVIHDISDRKANELQQERARIAAEREARSKSEFLANMSHEIRTPLNGVLGLARIGVRENEGRRSSKTSLSILRSAEHLLGVVNDILDFSKIEADKLAIESRPFCLFDVIDHVKEFVAEKADEKNITMMVVRDSRISEWVLGDSLRLTQILANLLSNAIKFTDQGEVRLHIAPDGQYIRFDVIDTGIGMTEEQIGRLFQPFEQGDRSTSRNYGGSGLGLAISQRLAHLMGGHILAESTPGRGSCFSLQLPLPARARTTPGQSPNSALKRLSGLKILVTDDVEVNRYIMEDLLTREGAAVWCAESGQLALEAIQAGGDNAFDIVLMDVQMPLMDGYEATRMISILAPETPVIGLTAHALQEELEKCIEAGMVDHVTKPAEENRLISAILKFASVKPALPAKTATQTGAEIAIDWRAVEDRFRNNKSFVERLVETALNTHLNTSTRMRNAIQNRDLDELADLVHSVKGLVANLPSNAVHELASEAETALCSDCDDIALEQSLRVADAFDVLMAELHNYLRRLPSR